MKFTLATFNTFWLFDNEAPLKRWGERLPDGGFEEKADLIAEAIRGIGPEGPDIVGLQEVEGPHVVEAVQQRLAAAGHAMPFLYCGETLDPYTGQNVAVLSKYQASISPVTRLDQTAVTYIDARERERVGSLGKFVRADIEVGSEVISLFVVHLKSRRGGTEETRLLRNAQAQIVRHLSRPRVEQGNSASPSFTAILGDMNDEPKTKPLDIMQGKLDTSYNLISATEHLPEEEQFTYEFEGRKQQLDHILLSKFTHDRMQDAGFTRVDRPASDHDAVWVTLDL
ncbi:endonuclease/exonuclease/phosphatase family protein [Ruegeria sp. HKCCD8929]|uniref:endonuclease/exonuclease/phosphatase family protein n=1 Tax=Ruegeria sp. HKCCD8929 TaxID=2683006 RepID=UPI001487AC11|nr:endonuclease/exonuclease/phosphatase family protein [Ruegeria sp. HKCCD8929]